MFLSVKVPDFKEPHRINFDNIAYYFTSENYSPGKTVLKTITGETISTLIPIDDLDKIMIRAKYTELAIKIAMGMCAGDIDTEEPFTHEEIAEKAIGVVDEIVRKMAEKKF